jgi:hypothetical protein
MLKFQAVCLLLAAMVYLAACGGSGGTPVDNTPQPVAVTFLAKLTAVSGTSSANAVPATTSENLVYGTQLAQACQRVIASRPASQVISDEPFEFLWQSVVPTGQPPQPGIAAGPFNAGDVIDLYISYNVIAGAVLDRYWVVSQAGLSYIERGVAHPEGGVIEAKFTYQIPYDFTPVAAPDDPSGYFNLAFNLTPAKPGGTLFNYPEGTLADHAQMAWEDINTGGDYDYNDFVASMHAVEHRTPEGALAQIDLVVKALARGAGYEHNWQFNIAAGFPGSQVRAVVDNYYDATPDYNYTGDARHGEQLIWTSADGAAVPVFAPTRAALPGGHTNTVAGTTYVEGDYAKVTLTFDPPVPAGTWTSAPYTPELLVHPGDTNEYALGLWRQVGDPVDTLGRPLGFIVPETWPWPLEGNAIWTVYSGFDAWVEWINDQSKPEPSPVWYTEAPLDHYFRRELFTDPHSQGGGGDM